MKLYRCGVVSPSKTLTIAIFSWIWLFASLEIFELKTPYLYVATWFKTEKHSVNIYCIEKGRKEEGRKDTRLIGKKEKQPMREEVWGVWDVCTEDLEMDDWLIIISRPTYAWTLPLIQTSMTALPLVNPRIGSLSGSFLLSWGNPIKQLSPKWWDSRQLNLQKHSKVL